MIPVGLARTSPSYGGLTAPWGPGCAYPELEATMGAPDGKRNSVYASVRSSLAALGLDAERFGTADWNPLGELVRPGGRVVIKPNFIRHWNPAEDGTLDSLITHGSLLRPLVDYAGLAVGADGSVVIAEAAQHDCDFDVIRQVAGLDELVRFYGDRLAARLEVIDLRREVVTYRDGVIVERRALPGDPAGYRLVDLSDKSAFHASGLDPKRFRGADYDPGPTTEHHEGGRHEYLLSETVLSADLVVNVPKMKTHKKTGVTLALKNLVGINGDKNLLPHHCVGSTREGGDEYPGHRLGDRLRSRATEVARALLARGIGTGLIRAVRRAEDSARGSDFVRSGNWHGNRTTWRMCLDLNRCLYYSDAGGSHFEASSPVRRVLSVLDGIVAGEGEGPLAPSDRPLGVVLASLDPIALDLAALRLMGFAEEQLAKIRETMGTNTLRISDVRSPADVAVFELAGADSERKEMALDALRVRESLRPHSGWVGHVEAAPCAA